MYDTLSTRETLLFYTRLRLPAQSAAKTSERVDALLSRLGLAYAADVPIGNALRPGISGGQRKRLSIGMELIDNPSLLFLGALRVLFCPSWHAHCATLDVFACYSLLRR